VFGCSKNTMYRKERVGSSKRNREEGGEKAHLFSTPRAQVEIKEENGPWGGENDAATFQDRVSGKAGDNSK